MANGRKHDEQWGDYRGPDRRTNGNGDWLSHLPMWVRLLTVAGPTSAIAVFLVWVGANEIPKIAQQSRQNHEAIMRAHELMQVHAEQSAAMFRMLQRICSNTARNESERERCFDK